MNPEEQRAEVTRYWWSKAEESLASAERELEAGSHTFAVNRLYYAVFYAASAALLDRGLSFKKHSGVRASFHREFIKTGLLDVEWGKLYDHLFEDRQEGDYVALIAFEREYVESQLTRCTQFLDELQPLVSSLQRE
ncbi:MAG: HEPN domain-containing protein [Anaerolineae bacterium]